jgi:hypothetical protein
MIELPDTPHALVMRADRSSDAIWQWLHEEIERPTEEGFWANVEFVEEPGLEGLDERGIVAAIPHDYPSSGPPVVFVVDAIAISSPDHPLLVVDLHETNPSGPFRAVPGAVQSIENNLSIANMFFHEFASAVGADGIFRGF